MAASAFDVFVADSGAEQAYLSPGRRQSSVQHRRPSRRQVRLGVKRDTFPCCPSCGDWVPARRGDRLCWSDRPGYAWPIATYPNFAGYAQAEIELPQVSAQTPNGEVIYLDEKSFGSEVPREGTWGW